jgi:Mn-dependent DtxR family transcriptional regulator
MSTENLVFRKIKEISARGFHPRPAVITKELASELQVTTESIMPSLTELKQLRLVNFSDPKGSSVRLTLLGSVVKRDK